MPKLVQVDGIGNVEFADDFSDEEIKHQVGQLYLKQDAAKPQAHTSTFKQIFPALFDTTPEQKQNLETVRTAQKQAKAAGLTPKDLALKAQAVHDKWDKVIEMAGESRPENVARFTAQRDAELRQVGFEPLYIDKPPELPKLTHEDVQQLFPKMGDRASHLIETGQNLAAGITEGFMTPQGIAMFGPGVGPVIGRAFVAQMAALVPADLSEAAGHYSAGDVQSGDASLMGAGVKLAMLGIPTLSARRGQSLAPDALPTTETPKGVDYDTTRQGRIPPGEPQGKEPGNVPEPAPGAAPRTPGGVLQTPEGNAVETPPPRIVNEAGEPAEITQPPVTDYEAAQRAKQEAQWNSMLERLKPEQVEILANEPADVHAVFLDRALMVHPETFERELAAARRKVAKPAPPAPPLARPDRVIIPPTPAVPAPAPPQPQTPDERIAQAAADAQRQHDEHLAQLEKPLGDLQTPVGALPAQTPGAPPEVIIGPVLMVDGEAIDAEPGEHHDDIAARVSAPLSLQDDANHRFRTSTGRIVDRAEGAAIFKATTGRDPSTPGELHSEDLYPRIDKSPPPAQPTIEEQNEPDEPTPATPALDVREPAGPGAAAPPQPPPGAPPGGEEPAGAPPGVPVPGGTGDDRARGAGGGGPTGVKPGRRPGGAGGPGPGPRALGGTGRHPEATGVGAGADVASRVSEIGSGENHILPANEDWIPTGDKAKVRANLEAIKLVKKLEAENRAATPEEKQVLAKYVGWGGLKEVFDSGKAAYRERAPYNDEQRREFENWDRSWGKLYDEVKSTLSADEHAAAARSILNAHYTSREIINAVWKGVQRLGFRGGAALEPAAGIGHFIGLTPQALRDRTRWSAVELDDISARIAQRLYPQARVQNTGFERSRISPNSQDLVISNVPFDASGPSDKRYPAFSLHNYFFARALDLVKPGGIVAAITSDSTMDRGASRKAREYFAEKADLVGAIRLPNTAFKKNAGTEVTTDILFFRKRDGTAFAGQPFVRTVPAETYKGEPIEINEYFAAHPDMMLGRMSLEGTMYGRDAQQALLPTPGADLNRQLEEAMAKLPSQVSGTASVSGGPAAPEPASDLQAKVGQLRIKDGVAYQVQPDGSMQPADWGKDAKKVRQAARYLATVDAAKATVARMLDPNATEAEIAEQRKTLNKLYDDYFKQHGAISDRASRFLDDDVDFPLATALEDDRVRTVELPGGKARRVVTWIKSKIFEERTIYPRQAPAHVDTIEDALAVSQNFEGKVDPEYMAGITGRPAAAIRQHLEATGQAFENPQSGLWENRSTYLSGFVKLKLEAARNAAMSDARYNRHVTELEKVQPPPIGIQNIGVKLGSVFVPESIIQDFLRRTLGVGADVSYTPLTGHWDVRATSGWTNARNSQTFGIHGWTGHQLVEESLNLGSAMVYDEVPAEGGKTSKVRNAIKSVEAQQKQDQLQKEFKAYIASTPEAADTIERIYNDRFNGVVAPKFEAPTWAHYPGASADITLREHQKAVVTRMLQNSTLLAHAVGTGKTYAMTTAAMEMRRLGLAKKPMIVVQNSTLEQFARSFKRLYPTARILAPTERQRNALNRNKTMSRIATGDWDAVIIPQSFINMLPDDPVREQGYIADQLRDLEEARIEAARVEGKRSPKAADLQRAITRLQTRLEELADRAKDNVLTFEQLGVDALFVDEAHAYKKLEFSTQMDNIKGLDKGASQRGWSMYMKTRWVQEKNAGRNVVFATGTPVSNTIAEAWNMMRYVRPDVLEHYGIEKFDDFAATFGDTVTQLEMTPGGTWKPVTRFARFTNGPELIAAWRTTADVVTPEEINLPGLPALKNGKWTVHNIKQSPALAKYVMFLRSELERFAAMSGRQKRENSHIPLVVFGLAKKASLDMRMIDPAQADQPGSKLNTAADAITQIYKDSTSVKGAQMVFSDAFQDDPEAPRFNLYDEVKRKLVERGVPEEQIAIITDKIKGPKRETLFEKVNAGDIRIVLGSTERMGVGVNAQEHLVALHHLDAPARPMDIEQRNGRILRQGNLNPEVEIHTYGVENTLDAAMFQKLATKQKFINQILRGDLQGRNFEDAANEQSLSFEEQMAAFSGDKRAMLKVGLENQVRTLTSLRSGHWDQVRKAKDTIEHLQTATIPYQTKQAAEATRRAAVFAGAFGPEKDYELESGAGTAKGRKEVAAALDGIFKQGLNETLTRARKENIFGNATIPLGNVKLNGQVIELTGNAAADAKGILNPDSVKIQWRFADGGAGGASTTGAGFFHSLAASLERIAADPDFSRRALENEQRNLRELQGLITQPFDREAELQDAAAKLQALTAELEAEGKTPAAVPGGETPEAGGIEEVSGMAASGVMGGSTMPPPPGKTSPRASSSVVFDPDGPATGLLKDLTTFRAAVAPQTTGSTARYTADLLRQLGAQMANELARADKTLRPFRNTFDRTPLPKNWKYDPTLPLPRNLAFIAAYEGGAASALGPQEAALAEEFQRQNLDMVERVQSLGTGALNDAYEHYFPHVWDDPKRAKQVFAASLSRRPLAGSRSFLKQRTYQLFREGLAAGLKPAHDNPVDLWLLKRREVERYILGQNFLRITREANVPQFVYVFGKAPDGYVKVDDPAFTVHGPPTVEIKEAFDAGLRDKVDDVMRRLGIPQERRPKIGQRGPRGAWGYETHVTGKPGTERITTKFGGPEFVKFHELGHALDSRYPEMRKILMGTQEQRNEVAELAKLRYAGEEPTERFKDQVQTPGERMAVVLQAHLHAPDLFARTAPHVAEAWRGFLESHPELKMIEEITPTLRMGEAAAHLKISGMITLGHWYYPEGAAYVLNNYLKPGLQRFALYRGFRESSNLLNGIQLVGGFHLGFVTGEAPINRMALAARDASQGYIRLAGRAALGAPLAPISNLYRGYLLRKEALAPGSVGGLYAEAMKNLEAGGFRFSQDPFWKTHFTRRTLRSLAQAWTQLKQPDLAAKGYALTETGKALANLPWAVVEQAMRPVMEYFVPWQKAGAAMEMLGHDMITQNPQSPEELRAVARTVSDSIDNRMGQMSYDNRFINRTVKDTMLLGFRAFGWQLGKYTELGGGALDLGKLGWDARRGVWNGISHRTAYMIALPIGVGIAGGMLNYLLTGQAPQDWRDLYMPRTGRKDQYGNDVRISLPTYMKDVIAYARHPALAFAHSLNPFLSNLVDLWNNRDFYNTQIRTPDESVLQQIWSDVRYMGGQGKPFFVTGMQKLAESDAPVQQQAAAFFGFMPASRQSTMTSAEQYFADAMQSHMPAGAKTPAQADHAQLVAKVVHDMRTGKINDAGELEGRLRAAGVKNKAQENPVLKRMAWTPLQYQVSVLPLDDVQRGWKLATPAEQDQLLPIILEKLTNKLKAKTLDAGEAQEWGRLLLPAIQRARQPRPQAMRGRSAMAQSL